MPTGLGARPTFSRSHPRRLRDDGKRAHVGVRRLSELSSFLRACAGGADPDRGGDGLGNQASAREVGAEAQGRQRRQLTEAEFVRLSEGFFQELAKKYW